MTDDAQPPAEDGLDSAEAALVVELGDGAAERRRIRGLVLPALAFVRAQALAGRRVVGISAPQGAGKTTLARQIVALLPLLGLRGAAVSIDDFYLPRAEQERLAAAHPGNPYLEHRGYPGTHDLALGAATLDALRGLSTEGAARVPVYDKSLHGGRGDRLPGESWRVVAGPIDVAIVEGWMLGFEAPSSAPDDARLGVIDALLAGYTAWHARLDALITIQAADPGFVVAWRVEAEEAMRASGRAGLSPEAVLDYVTRFLPAYARYAGGLPGPRFVADRRLTIRIGRDRLPCV